MRAANGMGTVSKLSGKRRKPWLLRDNKKFNEKTGKYERLPLGVFETKKEAETYRIAYFTNNLDMIKDTGIKIHKKKEKGITFEQVYDLWLKNKDVNDGTLTNYETQFKRSKKLHKMEINKINGILLQDIFYSLNLTNSTLRVLKSFWSMIFDFAILNDMCSKNYAKYLKTKTVEKGKKTSDRERVITYEELQTLWDNLNNHKTDKYRIIDMVLILCYTGLRISELLRVKRKDIFLKDYYFEVEKSKSKAGVRKVPIADKIIELFRGRYFSKDKFLWQRYDGLEYDYDSFDNHFRILFRDLDLSYHSLHDTRHTFATLLSDNVADKDAIIKMIGHSNYKITSDVYVHKNIQKLKEAVDEIK